MRQNKEREQLRGVSEENIISLEGFDCTRGRGTNKQKREFVEAEW
jgi:hypothetical protein